MDEVYAQQIVTVQALAEKLQVAPMTIRRDLHVLEQQGLVKKVMAGPYWPNRLYRKPPITTASRYTGKKNRR